MVNKWCSSFHRQRNNSGTASHAFSQPHVSPVQRLRLVNWLQTGGIFLLRSWVFLLTLVFGVIVLVAVSIPLLAYLGLDTIAKPLFFAYHQICAQIPSHSFYLLGHQLGLDVHCLAIYSSLCAGSLLFVLSRKRLPGLPWWGLLLTSLPLAYDGFTQLLGLRQSTWEIRLLTGALFGLGAAWFALPLLHKTIQENLPGSSSDGR
jgi:uncharacterized membrane protein